MAPLVASRQEPGPLLELSKVSVSCYLASSSNRSERASNQIRRLRVFLLAVYKREHFVRDIGTIPYVYNSACVCYHLLEWINLRKMKDIVPNQ